MNEQRPSKKYLCRKCGCELPEHRNICRDCGAGTSNSLVERLRALPIPKTVTQTVPYTITAEAADEIERLQKQVADIPRRLQELIDEHIAARPADEPPAAPLTRVYSETGLREFIAEHFPHFELRERPTVPPIAPLSEYLKDGETAAQCIQRNRDDVSKVLSLLAKAQHDADRYRWLRSNINAGVQVLFEDDGHTFDYNDEHFDEAVDRLMATEKGGAAAREAAPVAGVATGRTSETKVACPVCRDPSCKLTPQECDLARLGTDADPMTKLDSMTRAAPETGGSRDG